MTGSTVTKVKQRNTVKKKGEVYKPANKQIESIKPSNIVKFSDSVHQSINQGSILGERNMNSAQTALQKLNSLTSNDELGKTGNQALT